MSTPFVSVVIPTYNRATLLPRAIESALRAIVPGDEILVVDDASTDNTRELLASYPPPVRLVAASHGGAGATRNRGMYEARNELIAFLDSDDEWLPDKLALQRAVMRARPDVLYCFSDFIVCDRSGRTHNKYLINWHHDSQPWDEILGAGMPFSSLAPLPAGRADFKLHIGSLYAALMSRSYVGTFTLIVRNVPDSLPRFPTDLPTFEDWQFVGELSRRGRGAYLDCETAIQHGHQLPRLTNATALVQAQTRIKLLDRVWGSDAEFLRHHRATFNKIRDEQERLYRFYAAKELLKAGHMREARAAFAAVEKYPAMYNLLLCFPGIAIRLFVSAVEQIRNIAPLQ